MVLNLHVSLAWNKDWREEYRLEGSKKLYSPFSTLSDMDTWMMWTLNVLYVSLYRYLIIT